MDDWLDIENLADKMCPPRPADEVVTEFCRALGKQLFRFLRHKKVQPADAESLSFEIVDKVIRNLGIFEKRDKGAFKAWCLTIADNHRKNWLRSNSREHTGYALFEEVPFDRFDSDEPDVNSNVWRTFLRLNDREQQVVQLRVIQELGFPEIAQRLGLTTDAARQAFHRAKRRFAKDFDDESSEDGPKET